MPTCCQMKRSPCVFLQEASQEGGDHLEEISLLPHAPGWLAGGKKRVLKVSPKSPRHLSQLHCIPPSPRMPLGISMRPLGPKPAARSLSVQQGLCVAPPSHHPNNFAFQPGDSSCFEAFVLQTGKKDEQRFAKGETEASWDEFP